MEAENLSIAFNASEFLIFQDVQSETLLKKIGFPMLFLGVPDTRKLSNFAPCIVVITRGSGLAKKWSSKLAQ